MHIDVNNIQDRNLKSFLEIIRGFGLTDILVVGGAVRNMLLSKPCNDIDIALRIGHSAPQVIRKYYKSDYMLHPAVRNLLKPLAEVLSCQVDAFLGPVHYEGTTIDVLGLYVVEDDLQVFYPDVFVDSGGMIFGARPELTVNRIALDAEGKIWPESHIDDCRLQVARFTDAPLAPGLRQIVRALYISIEFDLKFTDSSLSLLKKYFDSHREKSTLIEDLREDDTLNLMRLFRNILDSRKLDGDLVEICASFQSIANQFLDDDI